MFAILPTMDKIEQFKKSRSIYFEKGCTGVLVAKPVYTVSLCSKYSLNHIAKHYVETLIVNLTLD